MNIDDDNPFPGKKIFINTREIIDNRISYSRRSIRRDFCCINCKTYFWKYKANFFQDDMQNANEDDGKQGLSKEMLRLVKQMNMGKSGKECSVCFTGFKQGLC